ncbi:lysozyme inhibitor LprI family protein [Leptotrichia buccalis]
MNKKITAIIIAACVAIFTFFLGGAFLIYNSFIKTQELQAKVKIEQEKTKQEMLKTQNDQQMAQVTTSQETSAPVVAKKRTNYEAKLMDKMASVDENYPYKAYQSWDVELNKIYKLLMSELPETQKTKLRNEERAWLKRMVNEVNKSLDESCGIDENGKRLMCGTLDNIDEANIKLQMVKARTIELARMYDDLHR